MPTADELWLPQESLSAGAVGAYMEGYNLHISGKLRLAIEALGRAIESDPEMDVAYVLRGVSWWQLGDPAKAVADFDKSLAVTTRPKAAWTCFPRLLKGSALIQRAQKSDPPNQTHLNTAIRELTRSFDLCPGVPALISRAEALILKKELTKAKRDAIAAEKLAGNDPRTWEDIALFYDYLLNDDEGACRALGRAEDLLGPAGDASDITEYYDEEPDLERGWELVALADHCWPASRP